MKTLFICLYILAFLTCTGYAQVSETGTVKFASSKDTIKYSFIGGLYLVVPDDSKTQGFALLNTQNFYLIGIEHSITLKNVDSIYKTYDENIGYYVLNFKFNQDGMSELLNFTKRYKGQKIGLMLDNKLINVATIVDPIYSGEVIIHGNFSEKGIDTIMKEIKDSIWYQKKSKGTRKKNIN